MESRSNNYNLLRLLLALLVMISHSFELVDGNRHRELLTMVFGSYSFGELAVNSFFILSGYLITASWLATPRLWPYLQKRLLRIVPGFAAAVFISLFLVARLVDPNYWDDFPHLKFWTGLLTLDFQPPQAFIGQAVPLLNGSLWTIHYEFICYLMLAGIGLAGLLKKRVWLTVATAVGMLAYVGFQVADNQGLATALGAHGHPAAPSPHAMGVISRVVVKYLHGIPHALKHYIRFIPLYLVGVCWYLWRDRLKLSRGGTILAVAAFALLMSHKATAPLAMTLPWVYLLFVLGNIPFPPARMFDKHDFSYGCYLYAWPTLQLLLWYGVTRNPWLLMPLSMLAVAPVAACSWFVIERPCLRLKPGVARI